MTNDTNKDSTASAEEILRQIEAFGADKSRWTKPAGAAALSDPTAAKALREAAALDRLLAITAPQPAPADHALVDRIVAAAERTPRLVTPAAAPARTSIATQARPVAGDDRRMVIPFERPTATSRIWGRDVRRGLAVLAASLVLGLSIGQSGIMDRALVGLEDITGVALAPVSQDIAGALTYDASAEDL